MHATKCVAPVNRPAGGIAGAAGAAKVLTGVGISISPLHNGQDAVPNYRVIGDWLKIDNVHPKIVLRSGVGRKAREVEIRRQRSEAS